MKRDRQNNGSCDGVFCMDETHEHDRHRQVVAINPGRWRVCTEDMLGKQVAHYATPNNVFVNDRRCMPTSCGLVLVGDQREWSVYQDIGKIPLCTACMAVENRALGIEGQLVYGTLREEKKGKRAPLIVQTPTALSLVEQALRAPDVDPALKWEAKRKHGKKSRKRTRAR